MEYLVESFEEALANFKVMGAPRWRRPNASGNFGAVKAVSWVSKTSEELGLADGVAA